MNERIKELWSKAGGHYNSGNQHTWPEYTIDDPKKFAELIVRKCANIVWDEAEMTMSSEVNDAGYKIIEYFGVAESEE